MPFGPHTGTINVSQEKTGPNQFVPLLHNLILSFLKCYAKRKQDTPVVFQPTYARYSRALQNAAVHFGLPNERLTSHSAPVGGALHDFCLGTSAETIATTGRWAGFTSLRHFLTNGRAGLKTIPLTEGQQTQMKEAGNNLRSYIRRLEHSLSDPSK